MELTINLQNNDNTDTKVKEVTKKMAAKLYQPTMNEVWFTGWINQNGTVKRGIMQLKNSESDKAKLKQVYEAIMSGEIAVGIDDMRKFTKSFAMSRYKVLQETRKTATIKHILANMPDNYYLLNSYLTFDAFIAELKNEKEFAIDTETTGLDYFKDIIVGLSFSLPSVDKHYYIPVNHTEGRQLPADYVFNALKPILENPMYRKILFNAKYDAHMLIRHGIYMTNIYFDGFVAMKLLNENEESYALKNLATKYGKHFGFEDRSVPYEELFGKGGFQDAQFETADGKRGLAVYYACKDTHLTYRFYKEFVMQHFERLPKLGKLYFDIERPITAICIDMEQNGFLIDMAFAERYGRKLSHQIARLEKVLKGVFGDININSTAQLSTVLYDTLGLQDVSKKRSTDAKTLKKLAKQHKGVKLLLKYRDLMKLYSTYIHPMPSMVEKDGRLHGQFKQVSTATGRFASSNPNLQNLPTLARKMIVAPTGFVIIGSDFSGLM